MDNQESKGPLDGLKGLLSLSFLGNGPIIELFQTVFLALIITAFIYAFLAIPNEVEGKSMEDAFHNGDLLLTNKFIQILTVTGTGGKLNYTYQRGDVIIFQQPGKLDYIKRVIAGPGDTIMIKENKVYVNGKRLIENYIPNSDEYKTEIAQDPFQAFIKEGETLTVPPNKYFVMGDNRRHSQDSRYAIVGWVDINEIKGRVFLKYWPITQFTFVGRGNYSEE